MKILEVSRYKNNFADHQLPFVTEQGEALRAQGCEVDYFLVLILEVIICLGWNWFKLKGRGMI